jgi:hypothetical protein
VQHGEPTLSPADGGPPFHSRRHSDHRAPLAFRAITTLPQPTAFLSLLRGKDGECPCCCRKFTDAG